jgi:hypothetical protein
MANMFGVMGTGFFRSRVQPGFFGRGPANEFLQEKFNLTADGFLDLWDAFACSHEKCKCLLSVLEVQVNSNKSQWDHGHL